MAAAATMAAAARELVLRAGASDMEEEEGPLGGASGLQEPLQLGELDITSDEFILDEVDVHIQANLEDELVKEALRTGVDLRHYSKQVELELQQIEQKSIRDYIQESENIASLHNQIRSLLITLSPLLLRAILEAPVTEARFLEQLQELDAKAAAVREQEARGTAACADVRGVLDRLRVKAVTKIREFILQKIYSFRKPMTNYQIPQTALLKYRSPPRDRLLGSSGLGSVGLVWSVSVISLTLTWSRFFSKPSLRSRNTIFTLGTRGAVISPTELEAPILVPHTAQRGEQRYPFEALFRSKALVLERGVPVIVSFWGPSGLGSMGMVAARVTQLIRGFGSSWKASVESLSQDVMRSFTNFRNGTSIIQGALTQLIQLYHRFHRVLAQPQLRALPARAELINIHHLMVELKKHKPNF
nr:vacuolar protein sorting-associated protein 52 homolog [Peromyscus maniculatus bairdii]